MPKQSPPTFPFNPFGVFLHIFVQIYWLNKFANPLLPTVDPAHTLLPGQYGNIGSSPSAASNIQHNMAMLFGGPPTVASILQQGSTQIEEAPAKPANTVRFTGAFPYKDADDGG